MTSARHLSLIGVLALGFSVPASAQTVAVTTTADCTGCGSLRDAINAVNAGTATTIDATGVSGTIVLGSALPAIVNSAAINAPANGSLSISGGTLGQVRIDTTASVTVSHLRVADALTKGGSGTLSLVGPQSYNGGTTVLEGRLVGYGGNSSDLDASLQGTIVNFGVLEIARPAGTALLGCCVGASISGPGSVVVVRSVWFRTGVNSYTGGTSVSGGHLEGNADTLQGDFVLDGVGGIEFTGIGFTDRVFGGNIFARNTAAGGLPLIVQASPATLTFTGSLDIHGDIAVSTNGKMRSTTASFVTARPTDLMIVHGRLELDQNFDGVFTRPLIGHGTFVKSGTGTVTLAGALTGSGLYAFVVNGGTLKATTFTLQPLQTQINNSATLEIAQDADGVLAGNISGTGSFVKSGSGTVTFSGTHTYSGGTFVLGGELAGTSANLQGAILNDARVHFVQPADGTYAGVMSGAGSLLKSGAGTLTLASANTYTGGTIINAGTLRMGASDAVGHGPVTVSGTWDLNGFSADISTLSGSGTVALGSGALTLGRGGSDFTFGGVITGSGSLTKSGAGTMTLTGTNTYSGGTFLSAGALRLFDDRSLGAASGILTIQNGTLMFGADLISSRNVVLTGAATFDASAASALFTGSVGGSGSLTKTGQGTLFLTGTSTYTGGTTVLGGALVGNTRSLQGAVRNDALVVFDQTDAGTFAGAMSGVGSVMKTGAGSLTFTGSQTYAGPTQVQSGSFVLNGSLTGDLHVSGGALLSGTGAVGGSLFVDGTYDLVIAGGNVTGLRVGGSAFINNGRLQLAAIPGVTPPNLRRSTVTILRASSIAGGFGTVSSVPGFSSHLIYQPSAVHVFLLREVVPFSQYAAPTNGVGTALESLQGATGDLGTVLRELRALDSDQDLEAALSHIAGRSHEGIAGVSLLGATDALEVISNRFHSPRGWWIQALGLNQSLSDNIDIARSRTTSVGTFAGVDGTWRSIRIGAAGGYTSVRMDASRGLDAMDDHVYRAAAYGQIGAGGIVIETAASGGFHRIRGSRSLSFAAHVDSEVGSGLLFGGVDRSALSEYGAFELGWMADAGAPIARGRFVFVPAAGLQAVRVSRNAFSETGAESLNLSSADAAFTSTGLRLQFSAERTPLETSRVRVTPRVSVRMTSELGSRLVPFDASIAGAGFTVSEFRLPSRTFAVKAGASGAIAGKSVSLDYRMLVAGRSRHHLLALGLTF